MHRTYNFIYSKLVSADDDFVGQIAYSLYKKDKITFIETFRKEHEEKDPVEEDFFHFQKFSCTESAIASYRLKAEMLLQEFLNNWLE